MSAVIKSVNLDGAPGVRALAEPAPIAAIISITKHDEERDTLLRRIARLEEDLRQRDRDVADSNARLEEMRNEATELGYQSGLIAAQDRQEERLLLLDRSMVEASAALRESMASVGRLAALLARDCVEIILGPSSERPELIAHVIQNQLSKLDNAMVCEIQVSRLDFPSDATLEALARRTVGTKCHLVAQSELPSGACVMILKLGSISVGIDQQWPVLRDLLDDLFQVGEAA